MPPRPTKPNADVFAQAAADARLRLRRDARPFAADAEVTRIFERLEELLFDPRLDVAYLLSASGASREARDRFCDRFGSLKAYVDELRVAVAERLLRETDERIADVGRRVGYQVVRTFNRTFTRLRGTSPRELRREEDPEAARTTTESAATESAAPRPAADEDSARVLATSWRRQVTLGRGDAAGVADVRRQLHHRYPQLRQPSPFPRGLPPGRPLPPWVRRPVQILPTGDDVEPFVVRTVFSKVLSLPEADRRLAFLEGLRFRFDCGFHVLQRTCEEWLRERPDEAVRLAELAAETVDAHWQSRRPQDIELRALAWTCLGRVRLLAGRPGGAEQALTFARAEWDAMPFAWCSHVKVRTCRLEAWLRRVRRRYRDAVDPLERGLEIARTRGDLGPLRAACAVDRADVALELRDASTALHRLDEAAAAGANAGVVAHGLARAHALTNDRAAAAEQFAAARRLFADPETADDEGVFLAARLDRDEARFRFDEDPERSAALLASARRGFTTAAARYWAAAAAAELAGVCSYLERYADMLAFRDEALAVLAAIPLHREARRAVLYLRSLPSEEPVDAGTIAALRPCLDAVTQEMLDCRDFRQPEEAPP
jgi:AraC-like DNA-binding protein